jgi:hypothetical protein
MDMALAAWSTLNNAVSLHHHRAPSILLNDLQSVAMLRMSSKRELLLLQNRIAT